MELSIPAYSVKEFTAILKSFKSFSDFLHIHPHATKLKISAISATRSTYAVAILEKTYFESYNLFNPNLGLIEIAAKPLHKIFAQSNLISALETCTISIDGNNTKELESTKRIGTSSTIAETLPETGVKIHRITIKLNTKVGITRTFILPYSNSRTLNPTDLRDNNSPNNWICLSSNLKQWIDHFVINPNITQNLVGSVEGVEDICFCYLPNNHVLLKTLNLTDASNLNAILPKKQDVFTKGVRQLSTSLTVNRTEFEKYEVNTKGGTIITTMSIKEVRSIFELGTVLGSAIDAGFSVGGRPVYFSITNEEGCIGIEFVLASTDGIELGVLDPNFSINSKSITTTNKLQPDQKGKAKDKSLVVDSLESSRANSSTQFNQNNQNLINRATRTRESEDISMNNDMNNKQVVNEEDEDELDRIPPDQWAQVEQEAIELSQTRKRARLSQSQSASNDHQNLVDDDDEQLLPSQAPPQQQPYWKLFFD